MVKTFSPVSLAEALELRAVEGARPFAGGTDLMVRYRAKNGLIPSVPGPVMFVHALSELRRVDFADDGMLEIGAAVPMAVLADDPGERAAYADSGAASAEALAVLPPLLTAASASLGAPALRQRATPAGNVANASPAGDGLTAFYALDAQVMLASKSAKRVLPIGEFVTGPGRTVLAEDELIVGFRVPAAGGNDEFWHYWRKVGTRRANALTKVSLATFARIVGGRVESFAMAFGAVGPTVVRAEEVEGLMIGLSADEILADGEGLIRRASEITQNLIKPIDDQRSTAEYRKAVAVNLTGEALYRFIAYFMEMKEK